MIVKYQAECRIVRPQSVWGEVLLFYCTLSHLGGYDIRIRQRHLLHTRRLRTWDTRQARHVHVIDKKRKIDETRFLSGRGCLKINHFTVGLTAQCVTPKGDDGCFERTILEAKQTRIWNLYWPPDLLTLSFKTASPFDKKSIIWPVWKLYESSRNSSYYATQDQEIFSSRRT